MIKKKICIGIIVVLSLIIIICLTIFAFRHKNDNIAHENNLNSEISNNVLSENTDNTSFNEISNENEVVTSNDIQAINNTVKNDIKTNEKVKTSSNNQNTKNTKTTNNNNQKIEQPVSETPVKKEENTPSQEVPKKPDPIPSVPQEKYVINDAMINKIKQIIQNNPTENMKTFGYNIVVDSSIKNQTNQFTFSESRVINAIRNKFGTIRIYVEDFYKDNQLIMTECYIL